MVSFFTTPINFAVHFWNQICITLSCIKVRNPSGSRTTQLHWHSMYTSIFLWPSSSHICNAVAVRIRWGYSTATVLHGSACWSSCSLLSQLRQLAAATAVLHIIRSTFFISIFFTTIEQWYCYPFKPFWFLPHVIWFFEIPVSWQMVCILWVAMAVVSYSLLFVFSYRFLIGPYALSLLLLPRYLGAPLCVCWMGTHCFGTVNFSCLQEHLVDMYQ